jgi:hypothetical protein
MPEETVIVAWLKFELAGEGLDTSRLAGGMTPAASSENVVALEPPVENVVAPDETVTLMPGVDVSVVEVMLETFDACGGMTPDPSEDTVVAVLLERVTLAIRPVE